MAAKPKNRWMRGAFLGLFVILAGGLFFIYGILPGKVASSIVSKGQVHKPVTQTPADFGMAKFQAVTFLTRENIPLSGWWIPSGSPHPLATALLTHGVFKNKEQMLSRAAFLHRIGCQVLLFDQRGHGQSGDAPLSGGVLEAGDYQAALAFLAGRHELKKPLVLFGFSLGAMSALRFASQLGAEPSNGTVAGSDSSARHNHDAPADLRAGGQVAVIADSPLSNLKSYVSRRTMGGTFASMPGFLSRVLLAYDHLTGLDLKEWDLDLIPVVEKLNDVPVVYITGEKDDLAKSDEVRKLFEHTHSRHKRLIYIPDAGHEETYKKYPVIYEKVLQEFLTDLHDGFPKKDAEREGPQVRSRAQQWSRRQLRLLGSAQRAGGGKLTTF